MSPHTPAVRAQPRGDTRLLDDIVYGLDGYGAILVASDLTRFPLLAEQPRTLHEVGAARRRAPRPTAALLTVGTAQGLLQGHHQPYALTPLAEDALRASSPPSCGTVFDCGIRKAALVSFAGVQQARRTQAPQLYGGGDRFQSHEEPTPLARTFTRARHRTSLGPALGWPDLLARSRPHLLRDIGGGSGAPCLGATRRWATVHAIVCDLAPVCEGAQECITQAGLPHRIRPQAGDMWQPPFLPADLHLYGPIYPDGPPEQWQGLTQKRCASLEAGGRIILHANLLKEDTTGPLAIAACSITMLLSTEGQHYAGGALSAMLTAAGCTDIEVKPTRGYWSIVMGRKP